MNGISENPKVAVEAVKSVLEMLRQICQSIVGWRKRKQDQQQQAELEAKMKFVQPFYYRDGDENPFCTGCFDKNHETNRVVVQIESKTGTRWECPVCKHPYMVPKKRRAAHAGQS